MTDAGEKLKRLYEVRKQLGFLVAIQNKLQGELEELLTEDSVDDMLQAELRKGLPVVPQPDDEG